jgi:hypothetical protein
MIATMTIEAATDPEIFLAYLDEVLCPKLRPGDVVGDGQSQVPQGQGVRESSSLPKMPKLGLSSHLMLYSNRRNALRRPQHDCPMS